MYLGLVYRTNAHGTLVVKITRRRDWLNDSPDFWPNNKDEHTHNTRTHKHVYIIHTYIVYYIVFLNYITFIYIYIIYTHYVYIVRNSGGMNAQTAQGVIINNYRRDNFYEVIGFKKTKIIEVFESHVWLVIVMKKGFFP